VSFLSRYRLCGVEPLSGFAEAGQLLVVGKSSVRSQGFLLMNVLCGPAAAAGLVRGRLQGRSSGGCEEESQGEILAAARAQ